MVVGDIDNNNISIQGNYRTTQLMLMDQSRKVLSDHVPIELLNEQLIQLLNLLNMPCSNTCKTWLTTCQMNLKVIVLKKMRAKSKVTAEKKKRTVKCTSKS